MNIETIRDNVDKIDYQGKTIYLVGTAHVSQESADLAREIIKEVRPDAVAIELCQSRYQSITEPDRWRNTDIVTAFKEGKAYVLLAQIVLSAFQKKLGKQLQVKPGAEMLVAIETAKETNSRIVLVDRDVKITLKRIWRSLNIRTLYKLLHAVFEALFSEQKISKEEVEKLKSKESLDKIMKEFTDTFPELRKSLIDERDLFLLQKIKDIPEKTIVAVIGAGHIPGMKQSFQEKVNTSELESIPPPKWWSKIFSWAIPAIFIALFVYGFFALGPNATVKMMSSWALVTGGAAALGALLAFGHPFSIIAAFVSAPITTLHPIIACGMVSAFVEAVMRKPRVSDLETITDDVTSIRGWYKNRLAKVFLMLMMTNLFCGLGLPFAIKITANYL